MADNANRVSVFVVLIVDRRKRMTRFSMERADVGVGISSVPVFEREARVKYFRNIRMVLLRVKDTIE